MIEIIFNPDLFALKPRLFNIKTYYLKSVIKKEEVQCLIHFCRPVLSPMYGVGGGSVEKVESMMQTVQSFCVLYI